MTSLRNDPAFQVDGRPIIDNTRRFYYGNSQGGIAGNMVMASSQDLQLGVLGVPGVRDLQDFFFPICIHLGSCFCRPHIHYFCHVQLILRSCSI